MAQSQVDALEVVLGALTVLANPETSQHEKLAANDILGQVKASEIGTVMRVAAGLCSRSPSENEAFVVFGYTLLSDVVQRRWPQCSTEQQKEIEAFASERMQKVSEQPESSTPVQNSVSRFVAMVVSRQTGQMFTTSWQYILQFGEGNHDQCAMVCNVSRFLCEEVVSSSSRTGPEHAALLSALVSTAAQTLQFLAQVAEVHYGAILSSQNAPRRMHLKLVSAALISMEVWCELVPLKRIEEGGVLRVCEGLLAAEDYEIPVLSIMGKLVERKDLNEADVPVAIKAGMMVLAHLRKYHEVRAKGGLDLEYEMFDQVHRTCSVFCSFVECHLARLGEGYNAASQREIVFEALNIFEFPSWEIHITSLPFWKRFLTDLNPHKSKKDDGKKGAPVSSMISSSHWIAGIGQKLASCLFELLGHLHAAKDNDGEAGSPDYAQDPGERTIQVVGACISLMVPLFPSVLAEYVLKTLRTVMETCMAPGAPSQLKVKQMRTLMLVVERGASEKSTEMHGLVRNVLEEVLSISTIGENTELSYWLAHLNSTWVFEESMRECPVYTGQFGKLLQKSLRSIVLDEASCARIIPPIFNILYSLTMPTAGLGLRVDVPNSAMLLDARQLLCSGVRQLAEQAPEAFLPHIGGFKKLVEQGQDINKITIRELNIFMEVLILASRSGPLQLQNDVLKWSFGSLWADWNHRTWLQNPSSIQLTDFLKDFLPVEGQYSNGMPMIGGCQNRWVLFHHLFLISNVFSRQHALIWQNPETPAPSTSVDALLDLVVVVAHILRLLLDMFEPANRSVLGPLEPILHLGREEMENLTGVPKNYRQTQSSDESYGVASTTISSGRKWLAFLFDRCTRTLLGVGRACPKFWLHETLSQQLPRLISTKVPLVDMRFRRLLLHQVVIPWTTLCPPWRREVWMFPMAKALFAELRVSLKSSWEEHAYKSKQRSEGNSQSEFEEIVFEILLREQTLDTANLLLSVTKPPDGYDSQYYDSLLKSLVAWDPSALKQVTDLCLDLLKVTDSSVIDKTLDFLKYYISQWGRLQDVAGIISTDLLQACLALLFDARMEPCIPRILFLLAEILSTYMSHPSTAQTLLKLPGMTPQLVQDLSALQGISTRKQKDLLSKTLQTACGPQLAALMPSGSSKTVKGLAEPREREPKAPSFHD